MELRSNSMEIQIIADWVEYFNLLSFTQRERDDNTYIGHSVGQKALGLVSTESPVCSGWLYPPLAVRSVGLSPVDGCDWGGCVVSTP